MAAETPGQLKQTLLADWWQAFQQGERAAILAYRREEVDQFNTACQQLRQHAGQLGLDRLQVGDRQFAVGDAVVCGKNALRTLGVANGSRGQVLALDPDQRSMTRGWTTGRGYPGRPLPGPPARLVDPRHPGRRTIDLGYASTGHRSQGVTLDRALVGSPAPRTTSGCMSPPPVPPRRPPSSTSSAPSRARSSWSWTSPAPNPAASTTSWPPSPPDGGKRLAVDTATPPALRQMSKRELRAERDRVAARSATPHLTAAGCWRTRPTSASSLSRVGRRDRPGGSGPRPGGRAGPGAGRLLRRRELTEARDHYTLAHTAAQLACQQADRAADRQRQPAAPSRSTWHGTSGTPTCSAPTGACPRARLARRADQRAIELEQPAWLGELGEPPATVKGTSGGRLSAGSSSTGSATASPTPTGRSARFAAWTWSSAATTGPPTR